VIELTEQVVAAMLIAARQGLALRERVGLNAQLHGSLADMYADLGQRIALVEEDRALDRELRNCWWRSARNVGSCMPVNEAIERAGEIALTRPSMTAIR
jgi:uncharacterized protein (DUF2267 family)